MRSSHTGSQTGLRRGNLALVMRTLREHGELSRAQLAEFSGLAKATVSSLVGDLELRGLVHSTGAASPGQGRPGQLVGLRAQSVCGLGLDVQVGHVSATVTNLAGDVVHDRRVPCDVADIGPERAMDQLAELAMAALAEAVGVAAGATVSVPGLVDTAAGTVTLAPRLRWRDVAVADGLAARTGLPLDRIAVDNDANLCAEAEFAALNRAGDPVADLVYVGGDQGIGGAVIAGGRLVRGAVGFAGEIGHMPMDPFGSYCSCGRRGCWETQVGLGALLHACANPDDPVRDPALDLDERMRLVRARATGQDPRTLDALHQIGSALGHGVSILVNLLNPAVVVLGGYFAALPEWLVEPVRNQVVATVLAPGAGGVRLVGARLGRAAVTAGAALRGVFDDPTAVPLDRPDSEEAPA